MTGAKYPKGGCDSWDLTKFDLFTLKYEIELCRQILWGVDLPQYNTNLKGIMHKTAAECRIDEEHFNNAKNTWLKRLSRAETELFERQVLL